MGPELAAAEGLPERQSRQAQAAIHQQPNLTASASAHTMQQSRADQHLLADAGNLPGWQVQHRQASSRSQPSVPALSVLHPTQQPQPALDAQMFSRGRHLETQQAASSLQTNNAAMQPSSIRLSGPQATSSHADNQQQARATQATRPKWGPSMGLQLSQQEPQKPVSLPGGAYSRTQADTLSGHPRGEARPASIQTASHARPGAMQTLPDGLLQPLQYRQPAAPDMSTAGGQQGQQRSEGKVSAASPVHDGASDTLATRLQAGGHAMGTAVSKHGSHQADRVRASDAATAQDGSYQQEGAGEGGENADLEQALISFALSGRAGKLLLKGLQGTRPLPVSAAGYDASAAQPGPGGMASRAPTHGSIDEAILGASSVGAATPRQGLQSPISSKTPAVTAHGSAHGSAHAEEKATQADAAPHRSYGPFVNLQKGRGQGDAVPSAAAAFEASDAIKLSPWGIHWYSPSQSGASADTNATRDGAVFGASTSSSGQQKPANHALQLVSPTQHSPTPARPFAAPMAQLYAQQLQPQQQHPQSKQQQQQQPQGFHQQKSLPAAGMQVPQQHGTQTQGSRLSASLPAQNPEDQRPQLALNLQGLGMPHAEAGHVRGAQSQHLLAAKGLGSTRSADTQRPAAHHTSHEHGADQGPGGELRHGECRNWLL